MFEGLEKGWTEDKRRASDKALLALLLLSVAYLMFVLIFEPAIIMNPAGHRFLHWTYMLTLIAVNLLSVVNYARAKRRQTKESGNKV